MNDPLHFMSHGHVRIRPNRAYLGSVLAVQVAIVGVIFAAIVNSDLQGPSAIGAYAIAAALLVAPLLALRLMFYPILLEITADKLIAHGPALAHTWKNRRLSAVHEIQLVDIDDLISRENISVWWATFPWGMFLSKPFPRDIVLQPVKGAPDLMFASGIIRCGMLDISTDELVALLHMRIAKAKGENVAPPEFG